jgi:hypothetical protein
MNGRAGLRRRGRSPVDDAHWADSPSLRFLLFLSRRLEGLPLDRKHYGLDGTPAVVRPGAGSRSISGR